MLILLVEDERRIAQAVGQGLQEAGSVVDVVNDGNLGLEYGLVREYDVIVLDILLPGKDGLSILQALRKQGVKTPILLLTARDTVEHRVQGLNAGADDYLIKPFAFTELLARIQALLRRPPLMIEMVLRLGDLELDAVRREVRRADRLIELSPREFMLLHYLLRHPRQVLSRTQIVEHIWAFDAVSDLKIVDVYIGYLRQKIDRGFAQPLLHTIRGVGYRIDAEGKDG